MRGPIVTLAAAACASTAPAPRTNGVSGQLAAGGYTTVAVPTSSCAPDDTSCVSADDLPPTWIAADGWLFDGGIDEVGDLNGDEHADYTVGMLSPTDELQVAVVFGPVGSQLALPDDNDAVVAEFYGAFDATGDGVTDLVTWAVDGGFDIVAGPIASGAVVDSSAAAVRVPAPANGGRAELMDADFDGDVDYVLHHTFRMEVWTGPASTWVVTPPTADLALECGFARDPGRNAAVFVPLPDITGDGIAEWYVAGAVPMDGYNDCGAYYLPADLSGTVDVPASYPGSVTPVPTPLGDVNGDGVPDFRIGRDVFSAPLTQAGASWTGTAIGAIHPSLDDSWFAVGRSFDGTTNQAVWNAGVDRALARAEDAHAGLFTGAPSLRIVSSTPMDNNGPQGEVWPVVDIDRREVRLVPLN